MNKLLKILISSIFLLLISAGKVSADMVVVGSSAQLRTSMVDKEADIREITLRHFLNEHNSPLADYSDVFIKFADEYDLDWRLVPAITGVESTFGKRIPANSYNAYGWANGKYSFKSWEESIEIVSKALREKYIDRGAESIDEIARRYAPPSNSWAWKVRYFMNKIDLLPLTFTLEG